MIFLELLVVNIPVPDRLASTDFQFERMRLSFRPPYARSDSPHGSAATNSKVQTLYCVSTVLDVAIDSASPEVDELSLRGHPANPHWAFFERPRPRIANNNETDN
jgi:hypothetical protein